MKKVKKELKSLSVKEYRKVIEDSERNISEGKIYAHEEVVKYMKRNSGR
jgi:hypothetical protein